MAEGNFVDYVKICCRSGSGGAGSVHFHRDKVTAKGGPDGGDGGRGGHIILRGNAQLWTLLHLKYRKHVMADAGVNGSSGLKTGAQGSDVVLEVPLGTVARDPETGEKILEITTDGQEAILLNGDAADREIITSKALRDSRLVLLNPENPDKRNGASWNSKYWPMWDWLASPTPAKAPSWPPSRLPNPKLPITPLPPWFPT